FFRWEFNSCEMLVQGREVLPIDYANACPDVAVTSLHYYFPWAMTALLAWTAFCVATDRPSQPHVDARQWFAIADDPDIGYDDKLARYQQLADLYFDKERYQEFRASSLPDLDAMVLEWVSSPAFDDLLTQTVVATYPAHEVESFLGHFRGLLGMWVLDQTAKTP
ncbi:MAG: hypothetical protein ABJA81_13275, partial [Nocardioidaceae bacterium]